MTETKDKQVVTHYIRHHVLKDHFLWILVDLLDLMMCIEVFFTMKQ